MAFPKKSDPKSSDNRARSILIGTPEPEKLDLASLEENAIMADMAEVVSEGNVMPDPEPTAPEATTEPAPTAPAPEASAAPATTDTAPDDVDDPRFKGKSKAELYKAYQNLERLKGEHDSELGNYRKLFMENVLKPQFEKPPAAPAADAPKPDDETTLLNEILTSPSSFKRKTVQQAKEEVISELTGAARMNEVQQAFAAKKAVIDDPKFAAWLTSNVPQHVAAAADTDLNTFNFIMKSYELANGAPAASAAPAPAAQPGTPAPDRRIPIGPAAGVPAASAAPAAKPVIFKQAELAEMMLYRPEEYARRQPEILAAYREGRIK